VNGVTPVEQVTDTSPAVLTDCVQPAGAVEVIENVTVPAKPLIAFTVTCEVPATVARVVMAGAERVKSWIVTSIPTVLVMEPLRPCTVRVNGVTPVEQVTDTSPVVLTDCVQPVGAVDVIENVTVPAKPLIALTVTWEVPAVLAVVVIAGADRVKSWIVTGTFTDATVDPLVPVTVTVKVPPEEQVTDRIAV
jgi:hypothetical protein